MNQVFAAADAAWRVLLAGIVLGAGLPALFSIGVHQLALGHGTSSTPTTHRYVHRAVSYVAFALVLVAIILGLTYIVSHGLGYKMGFNGVLPTFTHR